MKLGSDEGFHLTPEFGADLWLSDLR